MSSINDFMPQARRTNKSRDNTYRHKRGGHVQSNTTRNSYQGLKQLENIQPVTTNVKPRDPLAIDDHLINIVKAIKDNVVTLISSLTGSGKSTRVPEALANAGLLVMVSTPTRTATISLTSYVSA